MKLQELKQRAYDLWTDLAWVDEVVLQPENCKAEVRKIGDMRRKSTWERAVARFSARVFHHCCLDSYNLILHSFNFTPDRWDYPLRHQIFEEFLAYEDGLEMIQSGLEDLFALDFSAEERSTAHVIFELAQEQPGLGADLRQSVGHLRQRPSLTGAAAG